MMLAIEELSKAIWIDHYIWTSTTSEGYSGSELEQSWPRFFYLHPKNNGTFSPVTFFFA